MKQYIKNFDLLLREFESFYNFHDAEVVEISLKRRFEGKFCPVLSALIQVKNYKTNESVLVDLLFKSIFGLRLENFNHQNVLNDLLISEFSQEFFDRIKTDERLMGVVGKRELDNLNYYVKFEYCFGIEAEFLCGEVVLESVQRIDA